jgi:hypothetical protein
MRFVLKALVSAVSGIALGLFATWLVVAKGLGMGGDVRNGPWRTSLATGSAESGPYHRASIALHGLLALSRSETIYYTAYEDGAGDRLDGRCVYALEGRDPPSRWWSITAYGADDYLIANPAELYSVSRNSIVRHADGTFAVTVKRNANGADQIASGDGAFSLTLRLYNPDAEVAADPARVALPAIRKVSCA